MLPVMQFSYAERHHCLTNNSYDFVKVDVRRVRCNGSEVNFITQIARDA